MPRLLENVNFTKIVTVLAIVLGIALGSCGITAVVALSGVGRSQGFAGAFVFLEYAELLAMILSAVGLVVVVAIWIIASIVGNLGHDSSEPQRLFEDKKDDGRDEHG
jgi:hypothetical protein